MVRENDLICAERAAVATNVGDMLVLLDIDRERYFSLNKVGSLVWSTLQGEATFLAICSKVSEQFDVTYAEAARKLAERMIAEGGPRLADRIRFGFRLAAARSPNDAELKTLTAGYERYLAEFRSDPATAEKFLKIGEAPMAIEHDRVELAAYTTLASVLLNLDETIVKE